MMTSGSNTSRFDRFLARNSDTLTTRVCWILTLLIGSTAIEWSNANESILMQPGPNYLRVCELPKSISAVRLRDDDWIYDETPIDRITYRTMIVDEETNETARIIPLTETNRFQQNEWYWVCLHWESSSDRRIDNPIDCFAVKPCDCGWNTDAWMQVSMKAVSINSSYAGMQISLMQTNPFPDIIRMEFLMRTLIVDGDGVEWKDFTYSANVTAVERWTMFPGNNADFMSLIEFNFTFVVNRSMPMIGDRNLSSPTVSHSILYNVSLQEPDFWVLQPIRVPTPSIDYSIDTSNCAQISIDDLASICDRLQRLEALETTTTQSASAQISAVIPSISSLLFLVSLALILRLL